MATRKPAAAPETPTRGSAETGRLGVPERERDWQRLGSETFDVPDIGAEDVRETPVVARSAEGEEKRFTATVRIDTPQEWRYFRNGGILHYVVRQLLRGRDD